MLFVHVLPKRALKIFSLTWRGEGGEPQTPPVHGPRQGAGVLGLELAGTPPRSSSHGLRQIAYLYSFSICTVGITIVPSPEMVRISRYYPFKLLSTVFDTENAQ